MKLTNKRLDRGIKSPLVVEKYADNGALSHYDIDDAEDGETLITDILSKEQAEKAASNLIKLHYHYQENLSDQVDSYFNDYTIT